MSDRRALASLEELGFGGLEAEVYLQLLRGGPSTGYQVAQALGRHTANVYNAVEALSRRGAALVEDGRGRLCRAVPPREFLRRARRAFVSLAQEVEGNLSGIAATPDDERVWRLETPEQVLSAADEMLDAAKQIAVVDAFPVALERVRGSLLRAVKRGVKVFVEAYAPCDLPGASVAMVPMGPDSLSTWQAQQLNIVIDGSQHLLALLHSDFSKVWQAVCSKSLYMSCVHHAGRLCEHTLIRALQAARAGHSEQAAEIVEQHPFFFRSRVPGQVKLRRRFRPVTPA